MKELFWLLFKDKKDRQNQKDKAHQMVPSKGFVFKHQQCKHRENHQGDHFLYDLKLDERKWATVFLKTDAVGRHLKKVFKQRDSPADQNNGDQWQGIKPLPLLEF